MTSPARNSNTSTRNSPLRQSNGGNGGNATNNTSLAASLLPQPVPAQRNRLPALPPPFGQDAFGFRAPPRMPPFHLGSSFPPASVPFRPNSRGLLGPPPVVHNSGGGLNWTTDDALVGDPATEWSITGIDIPLSRIRRLVDDTPDLTGDIAADPSSAPRPFSSMSMGSVSQVAAYSFGGDGHVPRFQFEIIRNAGSQASAPAAPSTSIHDPLLAPAPSTPHHPGALSLYLTCHVVDRDYPASELTMPATIMLGLRERGMRRPSNERWLWRKYETHTFSHEREYWQEHMPPLSTLLEQRGGTFALDDLILTLQISSPTGQALPQFQDASVIPRSLLQGIESLFDDPGTGDVLITVCERAPQAITATAQGDLSALSYTSPEQAPLCRRRVIYAHSALLKARSSYFESMLGSDHWAEAGETVAGRRRHRLTISDFSFETVWWLLRWIYTDEICFVDQPDVRMPSLDDLPDGVLGTGAFTLGWNWQPLPVPGQASASGRRVPSDSDRPIYGRVSPVSSAGRTSPVAHLSAFSPSRPHGKARENAEPTSPTASTSKVTPADPHPHPAPMPSPTSALDVYRLAHRCELSSLSTLALDHLVATLTPKTAFPLLLISYLWQDLHQAVQRYTISNWLTILSEAQAEVKQCFNDVADGVFPQGGQTLFEFTQVLSQRGLSLSDSPRA